MPAKPELPQTPNPIAQLRAGVEAHQAVINAAKQTGEQLKAESTAATDGGTIPA